ncbi:MAG: Gfo/Idh/MocA family oxidoreductase [Umezawaea sp.]
MNPTRKRYAVVGTGSRAEQHIGALAVSHADHAELAAFADVNQTRMNAHNALLVQRGARPVPTFHADEFQPMLDQEDIDVVVVTSVDSTHDEYIVAALDAGREVVTEKPMTVDAPRCQRILDAVERNDGKVTVAFNYRFNPVFEKVRLLVEAGEIGEVGSVHFEWFLDTRHGADYFRRWHRDRDQSGGLMVHKATHHFDLINWWIDATPAEVFALGSTFFYGKENGQRRGLARDYSRAHGSPEAYGDPFALRLADSPWLKSLYLDAEHEDGYHRDQNVFAEGIAIEDDVALVARYDSGATLSYHLTAYSPWEGVRVAINGSCGRLDVEIVENDSVTRPHSGESPPQHGVEATPEQGWAHLWLRPLWQRPREIPLAYGQDGHGGADERMFATLYGGRPDPMGRSATHRDGARSLLTGFAANRSFETGLPVRTSDLLSGAR